MKFPAARLAVPVAIVASALSAALHRPATAAEFSITPIRAELRPGAQSETITITNESRTRLRAVVKLSSWAQDAEGRDVYADSSDLVYFPRQLDIEPGAKRMIRVGLRAPATAAVERTYRLFIEEIPEPAAAGQAAVSFYFKFGVPIFVPPPGASAQPDIGELTLAGGKLSIPVRNAGNQHFRLTKLAVTDGDGWSHEVPGWYSLGGTSRSYVAEVPPEVCRKAKTLAVRLEGEKLSFDRSLHVDPASCS